MGATICLDSTKKLDKGMDLPGKSHPLHSHLPRLLSLPHGVSPGVPPGGDIGGAVLLPRGRGPPKVLIGKARVLFVALCAGPRKETRACGKASVYVLSHAGLPIITRTLCYVRVIRRFMVE